MKRDHSPIVVISPVILVFMLLSPLCRCFLNAAEPKELDLVKQAAERDFPGFRTAVLKDKKASGLNPDAIPATVKLGKPVRSYNISEETVRKMKDVNNLMEGVSSGNWIFPVEVNGEYRAIFHVVKKNGEWRGDSYDDTVNLAHSFQKLRQTWSPKGEDSFRLILCDAPRSVFFTITGATEANLTPLTRVWIAKKRALEPPENLSSLTPASVVISKLKNFWAKGLHSGPRKAMK